MGPFPHDAPPATISAHNPVGTDGFEFVEFAHPQPEALATLFWRMGYVPVARHRTKNITVYRQGDINYIVNAEPGAFATRFAAAHGPCAAVDGVAGRRRPACLRACRGSRRRALHRDRQDAASARHQGDRRIADLFRRSIRRQGLALCGRVRVARRGRPAAEGRRLLLPRPPHPQCEARQHGQVVRLLCPPVQFPADPLLRYRGKADRPVLARAHQPVRADPHSDQRVGRRAFADRGIPARIQGRRHPAYRGRHRCHL